MRLKTTPRESEVYGMEIFSISLVMFDFIDYSLYPALHNTSPFMARM